MDPSILVKEEAATAVLAAISKSERICYECCTSSHHFLILGTSTGTIYIFDAEGSYLLGVIHTKEAVTAVAVSPNEHLLAVGSKEGTVTIFALEIKPSGAHKLLTHKRQVVTEHQLEGPTRITALIWDDSSRVLFSGNKDGLVFETVSRKEPKSKSGYLLSLTTRFLTIDTKLLRNCESEIVQLDFQRGCVLVSSLTGCQLLYTDTETARVIGTKPRNGQYGACFGPYGSNVVYCARPHSRLWKVSSVTGIVDCTLKLQSLLANDSADIQGEERKGETNRTALKEQFINLLLLDDGTVVSYNQQKLFLLDRSFGSAHWYSQYKGLKSVCRSGNQIYVLWNNGRCLEKLSWSRKSDLMSWHICREEWLQSEQICQWLLGEVPMEEYLSRIPDDDIIALLERQEANSQLYIELRDLLCLKYREFGSPKNGVGNSDITLVLPAPQIPDDKQQRKLSLFSISKQESNPKMLTTLLNVDPDSISIASTVDSADEDSAPESHDHDAVLSSVLQTQMEMDRISPKPRRKHKKGKKKKAGKIATIDPKPNMPTTKVVYCEGKPQCKEEAIIWCRICQAKYCRDCDTERHSENLDLDSHIRVPL